MVMQEEEIAHCSERRKELLIDSLAATFYRILQSSSLQPTRLQQVDTTISDAGDDTSKLWTAQAVHQVQQRLRSSIATENKDEPTLRMVAQHCVARAQKKAEAAFDANKQVLATNGSKQGETNVTSQTAAPRSFSLFDQLGASAPSFFSWPALQDQATNTRETLTALRDKVEYLEDVFPDWEGGIRPFLRDNMASSQYVDSILAVYAAWYEKVRSSNDFESKSLACDMVSDSLDAAQRGGTDDASVKNSVRLALDLFLDMMVQGSYPEQRTNPIGETLYSFLAKDHHLYRVIREIDPYANCLRMWIPACFHPSADATTVLPLLTSRPEVLSYLLHTRCQAIDPYALSTLRSILLTTRLQGFPWSSASVARSHVLGLFLRGLSHAINSDQDAFDKAAVMIYMEALDTINCGLRVDEGERHEALHGHQETVRALCQLLSGSHTLGTQGFPVEDLLLLMNDLLLPQERERTPPDSS